MTELGGSDTTALVAVNVILGVLVAGAVTAVLVAVVQDVMDKRRMRASIPDAWPPAAEDTN